MGANRFQFDSIKMKIEGFESRTGHQRFGTVQCAARIRTRKFPCPVGYVNSSHGWVLRARMNNFSAGTTSVREHSPYSAATTSTVFVTTHHRSHAPRAEGSATGSSAAVSQLPAATVSAEQLVEQLR